MADIKAEQKPLLLMRGIYLFAVCQGELVMERREYRLSSATIHKLLDPLFLNELNNEFENIGEKDEVLEKLHHKICSIVIFDPACSTGEVLAEAYIGLRRLENRILKEEWSRFISKD